MDGENCLPSRTCSLFVLFLIPEHAVGLSQTHKLYLQEKIFLIWTNKTIFCAPSISACTIAKLCSDRNLCTHAVFLSTTLHNYDMLFSALNNSSINSKLTNANLSKSCCMIHLNTLLLQIVWSEKKTPTNTRDKVSRKNNHVRAFPWLTFNTRRRFALA